MVKMMYSMSYIRWSKEYKR